MRIFQQFMRKSVLEQLRVAERKAVDCASAVHRWSLTRCSRRHSNLVICSLSGDDLGQYCSANLLCVRGKQHDEAMSLLSCHCPSLGKKLSNPSLPTPSWVSSPCLQEVGSPSLVKCLQLTPAQRKFSCMLYNSFCFISAAVIRQSSSVSSLLCTSLITSR